MSKHKKNTVDNENILQAVIIIDTFSEKFSPFCDVMPSSLLPLVNRPLLDYTLDCLLLSGVQEAILFCSSFADQIKEFISEKKWPGLSISVVVSEGCRSLGDAMRDLDTKALIRSDFILLTGNLVSNMQLLQILEKHKRIQKGDKGAVMTMVFKECGKRFQPPEDEFTLVAESKTGRVLLYSKTQRNSRKIEIPLEMILTTPELDLRCDLLDTQVSICSVAVPPLFSDNFDFQTKHDFVRGLLNNEEVLSSAIYCHLLPPHQYAASADTWAHYQDITHDVIHRWVHPMTPDMLTDEPYSFKRNNIYTQRHITLSQGCKLEEDVVIASGTSLGLNTRVTCSVIGKNCVIGSNVHISNSFVMDNANIQDGCVVTHSVVGPRVTLQSGAKVTEGSVLGPDVIIDASKHIANLRLQASPSEDAPPEDGIGSKAFLYRSETEDDSDSDCETKEVTSGLRGWREETEDVWSDSSDSDDEVTRSISPMLEDTNLFYNEVVDSLVRGYEDKLLCDNLVLEINSSRYAYNVTMSEVNFHVVRALLTLPQPDGNTWPQLVVRLVYFTPILTNYIRSPTAQQDCLLAIEDVAGSHGEVFECIVKLIHWLYEQDILSEEAILQWYHHPDPESDSTNSANIRKQVSPFIKWLKEAEEEQSSDEEESDSSVD